jgi:hypothetical protein
VTADERAALIERYRMGHQEVLAALGSPSDEDLDRRAGPGEWTAREVVHHLADSEMTSAIRLRKLLAEDDPVIEAYDEAAFAQRLFYDRRPLGPSLAALAAARDTTASILEHLTEAQWSRTGTHSESGPYSVETWLQIYADHAHDHANQIKTALAP